MLDRIYLCKPSGLGLLFEVFKLQFQFQYMWLVRLLLQLLILIQINPNWKHNRISIYRSFIQAVLHVFMSKDILINLPLLLILVLHWSSIFITDIYSGSILPNLVAIWQCVTIYVFSNCLLSWYLLHASSLDNSLLL